MTKHCVGAITAPPIMLAPYVLLRVAMIPRVALLDLTSVAYRDLVDYARVIRNQYDEAANVLCQAIYRAIPKQPDGKCRGRLLRLKRALHNERAQATAVSDAIEFATPELREVYATWRRSRDALATVTDYLKDARRDELTRARAYLVAAMDGHLGATLAISTPDLYQTVMSPVAIGLRHDKQLTSLYRFFSRAVAKTSPLGTLTGVIIAPPPGGRAVALCFDDIVWREHITLNRAVVAALDSVYAERYSRQPSARARWASNVRLTGGESIVWSAPQFLSIAGRPWRVAQLRRARLASGLMPLAICSSMKVSEIAVLTSKVQRAASIDETRAVRVVARLLGSHVLRSTSALADAPTVDLDRFAKSFTGPSYARVRRQSRRIVIALRLLRHAAPRGRVRLTKLLRKAVDSVLSTRLPYFRLAAPVQHVMVARTDQAVCGSQDSASLGELARVLQEQLVLNECYDELRRCVIDGGSGPMSLATLIDKVVINRSAARSSREASDEHRRIPLPLVQQGVTAFVQRFTDGDGANRIVLNRAVEGIGFLAARYTVAGGSCSAFAQVMRKWLRSSDESELLIDITRCGDCNDLQAHHMLCDGILLYPDDSPRDTACRQYTLTDLFVEYSGEESVLRVVDASGARIRLVNLGSVRTLSPLSPEGILVDLSTPYRVRLSEPWPESAYSSAVSVRERVVLNGVVLRRREWLISSEELIRSWLDGEEEWNEVRAIEFARRHGLPREIFVISHAPVRPAEDSTVLDALKPQWVDLYSPMSTLLMKRVVHSSPWVIVSEALPELADTGGTDVLNDHVTELHVEMLLRHVRRWDQRDGT
jgi:hypothetical protein